MQCALYAFEIGVHHFVELHCVMVQRALMGWLAPAVAMGGIQWRGLDHIPGSGDIWAQVISQKHTRDINENVQTTNTTKTQAHTNTNIHKQQL